jgi:hypothetical protein
LGQSKAALPAMLACGRQGARAPGAWTPASRGLPFTQSLWDGETEQESEDPSGCACPCVALCRPAHLSGCLSISPLSPSTAEAAALERELLEDYRFGRLQLVELCGHASAVAVTKVLVPDPPELSTNLWPWRPQEACLCLELPQPITQMGKLRPRASQT